MWKLILNRPFRFLYALILVGIASILYLPAKYAGKFSDWFNEWDLKTFGW